MKLAAFLFCFACFAQDAARNVGRQTWDTESGLPQNTVQAILQTHDGYLWFATEGGLARFNSELFTVFNTRNTPTLRSNDVRALFEDSSGTLWAGTADGITSFPKARSFTTADGLPSNAITSFFQNASHHLCVITASSAACLENDHFIAAEAPPKTAPQIDSNLASFVTSPILCSFRDREGNMWVGTESSGVTIIRDLPFQAFSEHANGLGDQVRCVYKDRAGAVWFGTDGHGLTRYSKGVFTRFIASDGLSSNVIVSLGEDASGDLLIGTPDGLNKLHKKTFSLTTSSEGLPDDFIRSIHTDADGTVWLGTRRGLARMRDGAFQTFTHADGLGSDLIGSIVRDTSGKLWIATLAGLSRFDGFHFENFTTAQGLSSNIITALYADPNGSLWIGTQGGGLNHYVNDAVQKVTLAGLPEVIHGITQDKNKNIWLASDIGIFRLEHANVVSYGVSDGLRVNECSGGGHPGIASDTDGGIWFATLKGAALLRGDAAFNQMRPPVIVESMTVDNRTYNGGEIRPGASRIALDYAGLSFTAPQKVQYRYQLTGFDKNWIDAGHAHTAFYTNLSPGNYSFHVIARNGDGVWDTDGAVLAFHLQPHFYQTWWFAALMVLPLTAAGYGIYHWRLALVQAQMESSFAAVLQERNRIAREIHDTLAQGFAGVSVQLEIVSRKLGASGDAAREHLDQARMLVRSSLSEARRSIWELRSQSAEIEDLASRLSKMTAQMGGGMNPRIAVQIRGTFRPLPARTEDELLRIAQEALTNAIKHAEASAINVELAFDPKLLRMTIADDGRGFSPTGQTVGVNGHFGLKGIAERAAAIDAKLNLDTAPGAGTRLSVEVAV